MLNEQQKRALELLDSLIRMDASHAKKLENKFLALSEADRAAFKLKKRVAKPGPFLPSQTLNPDWGKLPDKWAPDWCAGWHFRPGPHFADCLGIHLLPRSVKKKRYLDWIQETNFNFSTGCVIHSYPAEYREADWQTQIQHNPLFLEILEAIPANPVDDSFRRYPGYVRFRVNRTNLHHIFGEEKELETDQDGFIRYLITGTLKQDA